MADRDPSFETARLRARPMAHRDVPAFVAYRADPDVARFQSWSGYTLEEGRALVDTVAAKVDASEPRETEVGFPLAPAHQGKGYGTEALRGLLDVALGSRGLRRVVAVTDALNAPAAALLARVGMRQEAHVHENACFKGAWGSELLFAVLEREWPAPIAP